MCKSIRFALSKSSVYALLSILSSGCRSCSKDLEPHPEVAARHTLDPFQPFFFIRFHRQHLFELILFFYRSIKLRSEMEGNSRRLSILSAHLQSLGPSGSETAPRSDLQNNHHLISTNATRADTRLASELQRLLDHDNYEARARLKAIMQDPLFTPRWNISLEEERELALERLRRLCHSGTFSITDFRSNPLNIFAAHECAALADVSMATKMTVQFNLFGGTVLKLGTKRHHDLLLNGIDRLTDVGCFALTELGYGNNAVCMPTTATFDPSTDEFIIKTTTPLSTKIWATNGALHAHWAVVFAQLMVGGTNQGIHGFLVQIRDHRTMLPLPGVTIQDMGHKMGCNGVDNGKKNIATN